MDWQFTRYSTPILDLLLIIFSSTDKALRDQHYGDLLEMYYSTFSATIKRLGSDPKKLCSWTDFQGQMKKFGKFALVICPIIIQLRLATPEDVPDLDEVSNGESSEFDLIKGFNEERQKIFDETINNMLCDLVDLGYL